MAQSGGEAARSGLDTVQSTLTPALIVVMISMFIYMFRGLRSDVQKLSERVDAQAERIEACFDAPTERIDTRFDAQTERIEACFDAPTERIDARFDEALRRQDDINLRISAVDGRVARVEGFFEVLLAGGFKSVGVSTAASDTPPTGSGETAAAASVGETADAGEAASVESSAGKAASAGETASVEDSAEDSETTPSESELDPLPSPA